MMPVFPARRGLAFALFACGLGVLHAAGQSSGTPPGASGQATTADARARAWQTHLDLGDASPFRSMHWEPLGPSLQGGRIEAIAVAAPGSSTIYVGPGAGNVWKSTNNGMTWDPLFEHESAFAIGDIAVAPSNANIVWVGTGEVQPRHSGPSFAGTGVFKSAGARPEKYGEANAEFLHPPHSSMASYIATMFRGGASGRMLWMVLNTKPPPGMNTSSRRLT